MSHIPYGYKVVEGKAVVNTEEAEKVKKLYLLYIELRQYVPAARKAGIDKTHSSISNILSNKVYLEDEFYPQIIDEKTFRDVQEIRKERVTELNRSYSKKVENRNDEKTTYILKGKERRFDDPYKQAEYLYGLIEEE